MCHVAKSFNWPKISNITPVLGILTIGCLFSWQSKQFQHSLPVLQIVERLYHCNKRTISLTGKVRLGTIHFHRNTCCFCWFAFPLLGDKPITLKTNNKITDDNLVDCTSTFNVGYFVWTLNRNRRFACVPRFINFPDMNDSVFINYRN